MSFAKLRPSRKKSPVTSLIRETTALATELRFYYDRDMEVSRCHRKPSSQITRRPFQFDFGSKRPELIVLLVRYHFPLRNTQIRTIRLRGKLTLRKRTEKWKKLPIFLRKAINRIFKKLQVRIYIQTQTILECSKEHTIRKWDSSSLSLLRKQENNVGILQTQERAETQANVWWILGRER